MTVALERAIARVRSLPEDEQDVLASFLMSAVGSSDAPALDEQTRRALRQGLDQVEKGEFAADAEMEALLGDDRA